MPETIYHFRQPESAQELEGLLKLRYNIYLESRLKKFIAPNEHGLDVDCFDMRSLHYGLFRQVNGTAEAVGYIRIVTLDKSPSAEQLESLLADKSELREKTFVEPTEPFPILTYHPDATLIKEFCSDVAKRGERIVEPGRLSLEKEARSVMIGASMVAATFAVAAIHTVDEAIMGCLPSQVPLYVRFGFVRFRDIPDVNMLNKDVVGSLLLGSPKRLPENVKGSVMKMAEEYRETKKITIKR